MTPTNAGLLRLDSLETPAGRSLLLAFSYPEEIDAAALVLMLGDHRYGRRRNLNDPDVGWLSLAMQHWHGRRRPAA